MKTINLFFILFSSLLLPALATAQSPAVEQVNSVDVAALLADGALFVDVREINEVEVLAYELPGVLNLPLSVLSDRLAELPQDRPVVLACRSGNRSGKAAALLAENGFTQLYNLTGGIIAWETAGLPVSKIDRAADLMSTPNTPKACCSAKGAGQGAAKSCCGSKAAGAEAEKSSCDEKGKGKGKSCCAGGGK